MNISGYRVRQAGKMDNIAEYPKFSVTLIILVWGIFCMYILLHFAEEVSCRSVHSACIEWPDSTGPFALFLLSQREHNCSFGAQQYLTRKECVSFLQTSIHTSTTNGPNLFLITEQSPGLLFFFSLLIRHRNLGQEGTHSLPKTFCLSINPWRTWLAGLFNWWEFACL